MEEGRSSWIVVAIELDHILITSICVVQFLSMVGLYEIVLIASREKCWNETFGDMFDWSQIVNIKVGLALNWLPNQRHCGRNEEAWDFGVSTC